MNALTPMKSHSSVLLVAAVLLEEIWCLDISRNFMLVWFQIPSILIQRGPLASVIIAVIITVMLPSIAPMLAIMAQTVARIVDQTLLQQMSTKMKEKTSRQEQKITIAISLNTKIILTRSNLFLVRTVCHQSPTIS